MILKKSRFIPTVVVFMYVIFTSEGSSNMPFHSCQKIDACSCVLSNGEMIDLHGSANGEAVFISESPTFSYYFKYSPCKDLRCGSGKMDNGSLCIVDVYLRDKHSVLLAATSSSHFHVSGENFSLVYVLNDTQKTITSRVRLQCNHSVEQFVLDSNTTTVYNFTLSTRCACPGLCQAHIASAGMSAGTVLLLVFFSALTLYFGIGCVYRKAMYGGSCMEIMPHQEFWLSLPSLIRDGYLFFISPCIGNRAEYRTYDKL